MNTEIKIIPLLDTLRLQNISDEIYFSEKYADYISNSKLGLINPDQGGSWEKFKAGFAGNKIYSDSLIFGSAIHESQLQPESFYLAEEVDRPTAKVGFIADIVYKPSGKMPSDEEIIAAAKEVDYYHGELDDKKLEKVKTGITNYIRNRALHESKTEETRTPIYLDPKAKERYHACVEALQANKKIQGLLHPEGVVETPVSLNEQTILLNVRVEIEGYEPFILRLKSKLDNYTIDKEENVITVNDIKTTGKRVNIFNEAIKTYHYCRELGMYAWLLSLCAEKFYGMKNPTVKGNFLVVSTIPQYYTKVVPMTKKMFKLGFDEFKSLLKMVADYESKSIKSEDLKL